MSGDKAVVRINPRGRGAEDIKRRKDTIVQAVLEILIEGGPEAVVMRDIAATAQVSVPTLYNLFGSKEALMGAAMRRLHKVAIRRIGNTGPQVGFGHILGLIAGLRREMENVPVYARMSFQHYVTAGEDAYHREFTDREFSDNYARCLAEIDAVGELDTRLPLDEIAAQINQLVMRNATDWAFGRMTMQDFQDKSGRDVALFLHGWVTGAHRVEIERYLNLSDTKNTEAKS